MRFFSLREQGLRPRIQYIYYAWRTYIPLDQHKGLPPVLIAYFTYSEYGHDYEYATDHGSAAAVHMMCLDCSASDHLRAATVHRSPLHGIHRGEEKGDMGALTRCLRRYW
jgi:hypothetical protein